MRITGKAGNKRRLNQWKSRKEGACAKGETAGLSPLVASVSNQVIVSIRGERDRVLAGGLDEESAIKLAGEVLEALDD